MKRNKRYVLLYKNCKGGFEEKRGWVRRTIPILQKEAEVSFTFLQFAFHCKNIYVQKKLIPLLIEEAQRKFIKRTERGNRDESTDYAYFGLFNLSRFCFNEVNTKNLHWKIILNGIECLNWMHRYAQNEFENQAESYAKVMTKNKRYILRNMNWKGWSEVQRV